MMRGRIWKETLLYIHSLSFSHFFLCFLYRCVLAHSIAFPPWVCFCSLPETSLLKNNGVVSPSPRVFMPDRKKRPCLLCCPIWGPITSPRAQECTLFLHYWLWFTLRIPYLTRPPPPLFSSRQSAKEPCFCIMQMYSTRILSFFFVLTVLNFLRALKGVTFFIFSHTLKTVTRWTLTSTCWQNLPFLIAIHLR